jgi:integral membrane sensor domain MASE1/anti-sigma regulatory factor (Ser/Thr protein kinase)
MVMSRVTRQLRARPELSGYGAKIILVAAAYFGTAKLGLALAYEHASITAVWPPTGIALAALFMWGSRMWPGVTLGALLANASTGDAPAISVVGITIGNTLEALAGVYLLRLAGFRPSLERVRDVLALIVLAAGASTIVSATIGVTSLWIGDQIDGAGDLPSAFRVWWLGDMSGDLLVAPFLFVLASRPALRLTRRRLAEAGALLCVLVGLALIVFFGTGLRTYIVFPPLIWAAYRFGHVGAASGSLIVATIAVIFTQNDLGPFAPGSPDESLLTSQTFMAVAGGTALLLAAVTSERRHAEEELRRAHGRLEQTVEARTAEVERSHRELELQALIARNMAEGVCVVRASDSAIVYANPEFERMFGYGAGETSGERFPARSEAIYEALQTKGDGTPLWCRVHTSSFEHPDYGTVWVAVHEDITERKRADVLERSLVPERLPAIPGVNLAARFIPGGAGVEVGGDWYDVLEIGDGSIGLAIGDVAGRGVQAAAIMAQLRNALRAYALESHPPAVTLDRLNALAWNFDRNVMATVVYLRFDPTSGSVRLASAGHLPPLLAKPDGSTTFLERGRSLPLGARPDTQYSDAEYMLDPDTTLILYTDGLVERRRELIDEGLARLAEAARDAHDDLESFCDRLLSAIEPSPEDDVALLALETIQLVPEHLHLTMPAEPLTLAALRRALRRWLRECDATDSESNDIILACNEVFSNSIEHAYGPGDGRVEMDAALDDHEISIIVRDFGTWRDPRGENRGRGLDLVEAVMDAVTVVRKPQEGTEVRMVRKLERPAE